MTQAEAEACLDFVGFVLLVNPLRPDSQDVITTLQAARIRTAMVTGDHVHTAIAIARQCNLLPSSRSAHPSTICDTWCGSSQPSVST